MNTERFTTNRSGLRALAGPQMLVKVIHFIRDQIQLAGKGLNLRFGAAVDVVVKLAAYTVLLVLAVLAHHDDRSLNCGQHGKEEIQQDEGVWIPGLSSQRNVDDGVDRQGHCEGDDERPRTAE